MLVGEPFWNSITMKPEEYKKKWQSDAKFWEETGEIVYNRMVRDNQVETRAKLKDRSKETQIKQWLNS